MALLKRTLAQRLVDISKRSRQAAMGGYRAVSAAQSTGAHSCVSESRPAVDHDPGDSGLFRRFLHKMAVPVISPELRWFPMGDALRERLRALDVASGRTWLDGLLPPSPPVPGDEWPKLTTEDARKLVKVTQLEAVRAMLRGIREVWVPYSEFIRVCGEACPDPGQAVGIAKLLDQSGNVVVMGNMVLLRPDLVMKALAELIPLPEPSRSNPRRKELEELERQKAVIDREAESQVQRELWAGLGFLVVQTAAFMRLTFWELSWDVMEPICFYVTSFYFMLGYAFFLRTSREPSFEGFFQSRFSAKQRRLMRSRGFDLERYNKLRRAFHPQSGRVAADETKMWFGRLSDPIEIRN